MVLDWLNKLSSGHYQRKSDAVLIWRGDNSIFRSRCGLGWDIGHPGLAEFGAAPTAVFADVGS